MLKIGFAAAKAIDPFLLVISAGIAPSGFNSRWTHVDDRVFLQQALAAGLAQNADCIGAHANGPDGVGDLDAVVTRYADLAQGALPICVTEFGHALPVNGQVPAGFEWALAHTVETQSAALRTGLTWARASSTVRLVIVWNLNYDGGTAPNSDPNAIYALIRSGWRSPALDLISDLAH